MKVARQITVHWYEHPLHSPCAFCKWNNPSGRWVRWLTGIWTVCPAVGTDIRTSTVLRTHVKEAFTVYCVLSSSSNRASRLQAGKAHRKRIKADRPSIGGNSDCMNPQRLAAISCDMSLQTPSATHATHTQASHENILTTFATNISTQNSVIFAW